MCGGDNVTTSLTGVARIDQKIQPASNGCWEWTGTRSRKGYGQIRWIDNKYAPAHRLVYTLLVGPIPDGLQIDHLCRVRHCVNPAHLEAVTSAVNTARSPIAIAAVNSRKTHCPSGHPYSGENLYVRKSDGARICRECSRAHNRDLYWKGRS